MKKLDTYETRDLLDGRWALLKNGIVVGVFRSNQEMKDYLRSRMGTLTIDSDIALVHAIKKCRIYSIRVRYIRLCVVQIFCSRLSEDASFN